MEALRRNMLNNDLKKDELNILLNHFLDEIYLHARLTYPEECCGFILNNGIRKCKNIQNEMHG